MYDTISAHKVRTVVLYNVNYIRKKYIGLRNYCTSTMMSVIGKRTRAMRPIEEVTEVSTMRTPARPSMIFTSTCRKAHKAPVSTSMSTRAD